MGETCIRCGELIRPPQFGSDKRCAFRDGPFTKDNWSCDPVTNLRTFLETAGEHLSTTDYRVWEEWHRLRITHIYDEDESFLTASFTGMRCNMDSSDIEDHRRVPACVFMQWYKHRGRTNVLRFVDLDGNVTEPTFEQIDYLCRFLERRFPEHWASLFGDDDS